MKHPRPPATRPLPPQTISSAQHLHSGRIPEAGRPTSRMKSPSPPSFRLPLASFQAPFALCPWGPSRTSRRSPLQSDRTRDPPGTSRASASLVRLRAPPACNPCLRKRYWNAALRCSASGAIIGAESDPPHEPQPFGNPVGRAATPLHKDRTPPAGGKGGHALHKDRTPLGPKSYRCVGTADYWPRTFPGPEPWGCTAVPEPSRDCRSASSPVMHARSASSRFPLPRAVFVVRKTTYSYEAALGVEFAHSQSLFRPRNPTTAHHGRHVERVP